MSAWKCYEEDQRNKPMLNVNKYSIFKKDCIPQKQAPMIVLTITII